MPHCITRAEFETPQGRARARRALFLGDHGAVRLLYDNTHALERDVMWRTFQPSPAVLERWKARGVRTVVNLRGAADTGVYRLEEDACARLGMTLVDFRVYSREAPSADILHGARRLFNEIAYPAIMHCKSGADRVGMMSVLYRFFKQGRALDDALEQLSWRYGHVKQGKTGVIDRAFALYLEHARRSGVDLSSVDAFFDWVDGPYDHKQVKAEFLATWWGTLLTERLLRRE
ncbi:MAG: protein tyrosine phosphatase [Pseudomonadota bacterium]